MAFLIGLVLGAALGYYAKPLYGWLRAKMQR
jgi:hypothetical protein